MKRRLNGDRLACWYNPPAQKTFCLENGFLHGIDISEEWFHQNLDRKSYFFRVTTNSKTSEKRRQSEPSCFTRGIVQIRRLANRCLGSFIMTIGSRAGVSILRTSICSSSTENTSWYKLTAPKPNIECFAPIIGDIPRRSRKNKFRINTPPRPPPGGPKTYMNSSLDVSLRKPCCPLLTSLL